MEISLSNQLSFATHIRKGMTSISCCFSLQGLWAWHNGGPTVEPEALNIGCSLSDRLEMVGLVLSLMCHIVLNK